MSDPQAQSMLDVLRSDHRAIESQLGDPAVAAGSDDGIAAREQLSMMLVRHLVAEEQYLDPAIRADVPDGIAVADAAFTADRACEQHLKRLEDSGLTAEGLASVLIDIRTEFAAHVERQEPIFAALATACSPQQLAELGADVLGAEQLAPTRPRAVATERAGANKLLSLVEGFVDQVRDHYTRRGVSTGSDRDSGSTQ